jgi:hypothetical protein
MVMTTMVIIILPPPSQSAPRGSLDEVFPGEHAADARQEACWRMGAGQMSGDYSVSYGQ